VQMKKLLRWIATTALAGAMLAGLTSCGGGGVSSETGLNNGILNVAPTVGNLYAGVPFTFVFSGGTRPYFITSSEQTVIPLAGYRVDGNTLTVIPNNPGVVDPVTIPGEVPHRSVNLTVRESSNGNTVIGVYQVLQNFFLGYNVSVEGLNCASGTSALAACSGSRSRITVRPITNGLIHRNKVLRFTILEGQLSYVINEATGALGPEVTATTDEQGFASVQIQVPFGTRTQYAKIRITDVASGVYVDRDFNIFNLVGPLIATPAEINLVGLNSSVCGSGIADIIVTGGQPPYTASSSQPNLISIQPTTVTTNGGSFSVTIFAGGLPNCVNGQVVILDSVGQTANVTITTTPGTAPAVTPMTVAPNNICVADVAPGNSVQVLVSGGNNGKVVNVTDPTRVAATPTNFSNQSQAVTITAVGVATPPTGQQSTVSFYDGGTQAVLTVVRKLTCP
jgi:hypothetical protein